MPLPLVFCSFFDALISTVKQYYNLAAPIQESYETFSEIIEAYKDKLDELKENVSEFDDYIDKIESGTLTSADKIALLQLYPELVGVDDLRQGLIDLRDEAINSLAKELQSLNIPDSLKGDVDELVETIKALSDLTLSEFTLNAEWHSIERPSIYWFMQYEVTTSNKKVTLHPFTSTAYTGILDWGDGSGDVSYNSTKTYSHTYTFPSGQTSMSVSVKLYVDIKNDDLLSDLFSYDGTNDKQTVSLLSYIKVPSTITVIPEGFLSNTSSTLNALSKLTTVVLAENTTNALEILDDKGIKITDLELTVLIESALADLNEVFKKTENKE